MKSIKKLYGIIVPAIIGLVGCTGMNESIEPYLSQGEIIYISKPDSAFAYAGDERFMIRFWMSDPRATRMHIYWSQRTDSLIIPITEDDKKDMIDVYIGDADNPIAEGNYTIELVTHDNLGHKSIVDEKVVNVYGEIFEKRVVPKFIKSAKYRKATNYVPEGIDIVWGSAASEKEIGVTLYYTGIDGEPKEEFYISSELKNGLSLENIDLRQPISYVTHFLPEPTAIDTFRTVHEELLFTGSPYQ